MNPTVRFTYSPTNQTRTGTVEGTQVVDIRYDGLDNREPRRITETTVDGARLPMCCTARSWASPG